MTQVTHALPGTRSVSLNTPVSFASPFPPQAQSSLGPFRYRAGEEVGLWRGQPPTPNFGNDLTADRPGSAHSSRSTGSYRPRAERPRREPRPPPVSFRKPSTLSLTQLASDQEQSAPQPRAVASHIGSLRDSRDRAGSMSTMAKRRSMDLLDAVEEFRSLDFRSRVYAAGARDYGEDVADRNIMMNSTLSASVSTPDLYSQYSSDRSASAQSACRPRTISRTGSVDPSDSHVECSTHRGTSPPFITANLTSFSRKNKMRLFLNTYKPSGLNLPDLHTPRSAALALGHCGGMTPSVFEFHSAISPRLEPDMVNSPAFEPDAWSRQYHKSPIASNFSIPRSPKAVRLLMPEVEQQNTRLVEEGQDSVEGSEFVDIPTVHRSSSRKSAASVGHVPATIAARFSQATYRSSMASTVTSRYPSMDFQPLGYPKSHSHGAQDLGESSVLDNVFGPRIRSHSLRKLPTTPSSHFSSHYTSGTRCLHQL